MLNVHNMKGDFVMIYTKIKRKIAVCMSVAMLAEREAGRSPWKSIKRHWHLVAELGRNDGDNYCY